MIMHVKPCYHVLCVNSAPKPEPLTRAYVMAQEHMDKLMHNVCTAVTEDLRE